MRMIASALAMLLVSGPALAEQVSALGTWTVSAVETDPAMPVTGVGENDPSYMGAKLTITRDGISWNTAATDGQGTYDACPSPRFAAFAHGVVVTCGGQPWGPDATLAPVSSAEIRLPWFDGGILVLTRD